MIRVSFDIPLVRCTNREKVVPGIVPRDRLGGAERALGSGGGSASLEDVLGSEDVEAGCDLLHRGLVRSAAPLRHALQPQPLQPLWVGQPSIGLK